jgi:DNA invertase Pin-like site-specific DNA recombinase
VGFLSELHAAGVDLFLHQQGIDTTTPAGKAMFQMMGVFAEFERAMIRERVNAGLARAKAQGKVLGRPKIDAATEKAIADALRAGGAGIQKVAKLHGVGVGTVQRVKAKMMGHDLSEPIQPTAPAVQEL